METLLIVEDADSLREVLTTFLESKGYRVSAFQDAEQAISAFQKGGFSGVLADFKLPKKNGIDFLTEVRTIDATVPFIMMTAYGSVEIAVEAMKRGANDFITKPFEPERLSNLVEQVLEFRRIVDRQFSLKNRRGRRFLTAAPGVDKLIAQAKKAARVDSSILLLGESGTGKELIARMIHENSPRRNYPFVAVNCAALPEDLLESEFFGHEAGSYTGATQKRIGIFEYASAGTIFLDEIGDMAPLLQVKLLRALQEREIKRIGGTQPIPVNPRIIAATNYDPEEAIGAQRLREDFYYRLAVISFKIPPLRERPEDIPLLTKYFIDYFCSATGRTELTLTKSAEAMLNKYSWPGNARELENVLERAVILAENSIHPEHLGINLQLDFSALEESQVTLQEISARASEKAEREIIAKTLERTRGNKTVAAKLLGVSYKTLLNKVKEYELEVSAAQQ